MATSVTQLNNHSAKNGYTTTPRMYSNSNLETMTPAPNKNFANKDMTPSYNLGRITPSETQLNNRAASNGYTTTPRLYSNSNLESRQALNRDSSYEKNFTDQEKITPGPNNSQVKLTIPQEYQSPVNANPSINDPMIQPNVPQ